MRARLNYANVMAPIGTEVQETILDVDGFEIAAACEDDGGLPSLTYILTYPEDGRTASQGIARETGNPTQPTLGERAVDGGVAEAASAAPSGEGDRAEAFLTQTYTAEDRSVLLTINILVDDDEGGASLCRLNGVLVPTP